MLATTPRQPSFRFRIQSSKTFLRRRSSMRLNTTGLHHTPSTKATGMSTSQAVPDTHS